METRENSNENIQGLLAKSQFVPAAASGSVPSRQEPLLCAQWGKRPSQVCQLLSQAVLLYFSTTGVLRRRMAAHR